MKAWILAARPKTLPAAIVPVWVGSAPALLSPGAGSWLLFFCTLFSCLCIQIATNLFNDAIDHKKGADTENRLGPVRATASGMLSQGLVMGIAVAFCALAALIAIPLITERGWPIIAIGLVSLFFSYGYTGGPFPLAYRGMGEIFVILFFGFVAVIGSYFVQTGEWGSKDAWIVGLQCGFYSTVMLAVNNLRDVDEDRQTGKHTVAVRVGKRCARWEVAFFCFAPIVLWLFTGAGWVGFVVAAAASGMTGLVITRGVFQHEPGRIYNKFLAIGGVQLLVFGMIVGVLITRLEGFLKV